LHPSFFVFSIQNFFLEIIAFSARPGSFSSQSFFNDFSLFSLDNSLTKEILSEENTFIVQDNLSFAIEFFTSNPLSI